MKTCCAVELLLGLPLSLEPLLGYSQAVILPVIFPGDLGLRGEDSSLPWVSCSSLTLSGCQQHQEAASICGTRKVVPNVPEFIFLLLHKASTQHRLPRRDEWKINRHCGIFFFPCGMGGCQAELHSAGPRTHLCPFCSHRFQRVSI